MSWLNKRFFIGDKPGLGKTVISTASYALYRKKMIEAGLPVGKMILVTDNNHALGMSKEMREKFGVNLLPLIDGTDKIERTLKKKKLSIPDAEKEIKKLYKKQGYDRGITLYNSLDKDYRLWGKINMSWPNADTFGPTYNVLHPKTLKPVKVPDRGWRWKEETFNEAAGFKNGKYENIIELHDGIFICLRLVQFINAI